MMRSYGTARAFIKRYGGSRRHIPVDWGMVARLVKAGGFTGYWRKGEDWWTPADGEDGKVPSDAEYVSLASAPGSEQREVTTNARCPWCGQPVILAGTSAHPVYSPLDWHEACRDEALAYALQWRAKVARALKAANNPGHEGGV